MKHSFFVPDYLMYKMFDISIVKAPRLVLLYEAKRKEVKLRIMEMLKDEILKFM